MQKKGYCSVLSSMLIAHRFAILRDPKPLVVLRPHLVQHHAFAAGAAVQTREALVALAGDPFDLQPFSLSANTRTQISSIDQLPWLD